MELTEVFAPGGLISKAVEGYEHRSQQELMAGLVESTIRNNRTAVIEGATGVGKSFAYLIPAILSGKQTIVSTSNKTLQDQLSKKDLPKLQEILPMFNFVVVKGKSNYLCPFRFEINKAEIILIEGETTVAMIDKWVEETEDGDVEYYPGELSPKIREMITCDRNMQHERKSSEWESCFAAQAKVRAKDANVILVNHTLLALDKHLRFTTDGKAKILPDADIFILDEAHAFYNYAVKAFSDEVSIHTLRHYLNWRMVKNVISKSLSTLLVSEFKLIADRYLPAYENGYYTQNGVDCFDCFDKVFDQIEGINNTVRASDIAEFDQKGLARKNQIVKEGENIINRLSTLGTIDENSVKWSEAYDPKYGGGPIVTLKSAPLSVSHVLGESLFKDKTVICTSATLSVNGKFDFFCEQMGVPEGATELVVDSPFDYANNAMVYFTKGDLARELDTLLEASQGRALVLFTSYKAMKAAYECSDVDYPRFIQGEMGKMQLLDAFRNTPNAVLFATKSFWEGVDVKGEQLSLVVIDKIPFPNIGDLLFKKRCDQIDARYGRGASFRKLSIPEASLALKQGVGRLIRSKSDKGVMALLDNRINTANYAKAIVSAFPEHAPRTQKMEIIQSFFAQINSCKSPKQSI